jgi:two-component system, response regulator YesN
MKSNVFRVVVADDEKLIANNIAKNITGCDPSFEVVSICFDGASALKAIEEHDPHVLFTDIKMPLMDGLALIESIHNNSPQIRCVIISGYNDFEYAKTAIKFKAYDYLLKPINKFELSKTLRKIKDELLSEQAMLNSERETSAENIVNSIVQYLQLNYAKDINFTEIASNYNFSASYLTKIFKEYAGTSPIKYLIDFRIKVAKNLLKNTNLTVKEISEKTGFQDQFYFSKCFKNNCGVTPSQYKE